jgi:hypothetical protein
LRSAPKRDSAIFASCSVNASVLATTTTLSPAASRSITSRTAAARRASPRILVGASPSTWAGGVNTIALRFVSRLNAFMIQ